MLPAGARYWPYLYAAAFVTIGVIFTTGVGLVTHPRFGQFLAIVFFVAAGLLAVHHHHPRLFLTGVAVGLFGMLVRAWDLILDTNVQWQQRTLGALLWFLCAFGLMMVTATTGRAGHGSRR